MITNLSLIQSPLETRLFLAFISTGFGLVTPSTEVSQLISLKLLSMAGFFPVKCSVGGHQLITAETSQNMYTVNLSMLITSFMAIADRAARLTEVHKHWSKSVDWLQKHQPLGAGARYGPVQMTWLRSYHFLASLGFLWMGSDKSLESRAEACPL